MSSATTSVDYLRTLLGQHATTFDEELYMLCKDYCNKNRAAFQTVVTAKSKAHVSTDELRQLTLREQLEVVLDRPFATVYGRIFLFTQTTLVVGSCASLMLETVPRYNGLVDPRYDTLWFWMECGMTACFTFETVLRFIVSVPKLEFAKRVMNWMDILSVMPFYIELMSSEDSQLAPFRVVRLVRLMKFLRNLQAVDNLVTAMERSMRALVAPLVFLAACMLFMSGIVFYAEKGDYDDETKQYLINDCACEATARYHYLLRNNGTDAAAAACPKVPSQFYSIPHTFWWAVVTMTTVGYGDLVPRCALGKFFGAVSIVLGVFFMAMPIAIVGSYFTIVVDETEREERQAKHRIVEQERNERRYLVDVVQARELETCSDTQIALFCKNLKVTPCSERAKTEDMIYAMVLPPDPTEPTAAKKLIRYLHRNIPEQVVSLKDPSPPVLHHLEAFLSSPQQELPSSSSSSSSSLMCPGMLHCEDLKFTQYILSKPIALTVGGRHSTSAVVIPPPDIELPTALLPQRVAVFWATITPLQWAVSVSTIPPTVVRVNGNDVSCKASEGTMLRPGDVLDFILGRNSVRVVYTELENTFEIKNNNNNTKTKIRVSDTKKVKHVQIL
eukprot:PhM_4_TR10351/c1_g1_i1/m.59935/K04885/KCNB1; potassium voltage-gated channel Shab-related subfamily B member 1